MSRRLLTLCDLYRMHDAIGNAEVMLYAVSEKYKESGSCRLEASYARQLGIEMIPLTVQDGYLPTGWLRLVRRAWNPLVMRLIDQLLTRCLLC